MGALGSTAALLFGLYLFGQAAWWTMCRVAALMVWLDRMGYGRHEEWDSTEARERADRYRRLGG